MELTFFPEKKMRYIIIYAILLIAFYYIIKRSVQNRAINYGVSEKYVRFGQTVVLSGSNKTSGESYRYGILVGYQRYNYQRGTKPELQLISVDDRYEPDVAISNAQTLINYYDVFGIIGTWGTPTSYQIYQNVLSAKNITFVGPFTGSNLLRKSFDPDNIFIRPSYGNEVRVILDYMAKQNKYHFSVMYQDDEYGISTLQDTENLIIQNPNYQMLSKGSYTRNTPSIEDGLSAMLGISNPFDADEVKKSQFLKEMDFILLITTTEQAYYCIEFFKNYRPEIPIFCISGVNVQTLKLRLPTVKNLNHIYSTMVVPIYETQTMFYTDMLEDIKIFNDNYNIIYPVSETFQEGYIIGRLLGEIMKDFNIPITRDNFINYIYQKQTFDISGLKLGPFINTPERMNNVGLDTIYLIKYNPELKDYERLESFNVQPFGEM